jgi:hypothetical protein
MKKAISSMGSGVNHVSDGWKKKPKRKKPVSKPKTKSGGKSMKKNYTALIKNVDQEQRIISGPVLVPDEEDLQKDLVSEHEIVKAAHGFMKDYQNINLMHSNKYDEFTQDVVPVESVVLKNDVDFYGNGEVLKKGTWILDVFVGNDDVWDLIKDGKIRGYSVEGEATREEI